MSNRPAIGRGLFYTRDSQGHSEMAPPQYVAWARGEAARLGVRFDGMPETISMMIKEKLSQHGDIYLDYGISGNHLSRPGWNAFQDRELSDGTISHLFVPRRDRIARPDNALDAVATENELRAAGLTIVMMERIFPPYQRGKRIDLAEHLTSLIDYDISGKFRHDLAEKLIYAKLKLAEGGFSIGGEPTYGFRRWLIGVDGTRKRQLEEGEIVKMAGHHVVWLPTDEREMDVVRRIFDLIETTPASRIARILNDERIPSPKAGRVRVCRGISISNSGLWGQNTVKSIASHPLLIACCEYGRRASGDQLRLSPTGPRALTDGDYRADGKPKTVRSPADLVIRTRAGFEPIISDERHGRILGIIEGRGKHLKGKARTRGDSPNSMGGRIHDLNCGWPMYRHARRGRWGYQCGLYQNSQAKACRHNVVDGDLTTGFVLACVRQRLLAPTAKAKLEARLRELADAESGETASRRKSEFDRAKLSALERRSETVGRNMALAETPEERAATAVVLAETNSDIRELRARLETQRRPTASGSKEEQIGPALAVLDNLTRLAESPEDQRAIGDLFRRLNVQLYLRFRETDRGRRKISEVGGGILTFGSTPPPTSLYDGPTDRAIVRHKLAAGEPVSAGLGNPSDCRCISQSVPKVNWSANVQRGT